MDMYRILENFDAVNSKQTLAEGDVKHALHKKAERMSKADFISSVAGPKAPGMNMSAKEATEFWNNINGEDDEELDEGFLGFGMPKFKVDMDRSAHAGGLLDITGSERDGKKVMAALQKANPELAAQGRHIGGSGRSGYVYYGIAFPSTALAQQAAAALGGVAEGRRTDADWDDAAIQSGKRGRDARDNPSRHAARAKAGQAMRGNAKPDFLDLDRDGDKTEPMKSAAKGVAEGDMETVREVFPGTPEYELRFGKTDAGSAFDKKKISTGTVYSRKHFDEPEADDDDAPRSAGRPKGTGRKLGAKGPSVASKLLKGKGGLKEHDDEIDIADRGEYDREGDMALNQVHQIADAVRELHEILAADDNLPEWVQSKITKALDYIDTARDYLDAEGEMDREELPEIAPIVGALAGRALAGAAGAGSTGQAIGSLAGRAVAGAMNSGDDEVAEASPPGEFKPGDRVLYMNKFATIIAQDGDAYGIRIDGKPGTMMVPVSQIKKPSYDEGVAEAGYSAKAGRAGKDLGKPGKNFSKIAAGAAERYGSKAAGERVAGSVLNKLRHPTEEGQLDELSPKTLGSYVKKAASDVNTKSRDAQQHKDMFAGDYPVRGAKKQARQNQADIDKRVGGIGRAVDRMSKEGIDEQGTDEGYFSDLDVQRKDKQLKGTQAYHAKKKSEKEQRSADSKQSFNNMFGGSPAELTSKLKIRDVEEDQLGELYPPFTPDTKSSFKKSTNPNRTNTDTVKALAQKGLADMTTAELKAELKRRDKAEESTDVKDQHAEKAGKKVTQDIESDDKKGKKEVEETTVSGSVAPAAGGAAPKSKNGMQFGKGVYEGQVAESFESKLHNILNEGMSVNVSTDDTGKKSISVNATDADADALGDMLKMAGLFSSEGYSSVCQGCGGIHKAGDCGADMVEEELANSPDEVYTDADYMTQTLSGGLNGPKRDQTTNGIVKLDHVAEQIKETANTRLWNLYKQYEKK